MNKSGLINEVAKVVGTKKAAREVVDCIFSTITKNLGRRSRVQGFKVPFSSPGCIWDEYLREKRQFRQA
ncbi:MAG: hypothetical protein SRB2_03978 [Desulfobacteraceae bacterium Eth-SRB2]|nr:MAG: hypothetical protein SRB2_03978 [Desulfobacteraceae bacterium Eth-SRB2]